MNAEYLLLVGTYTEQVPHVPFSAGEGIVTCALDRRSGVISRRGVFSGVVNPACLALAGDGRQVLAASEIIDGDGWVWQLACDREGRLEEVARQGSRGRATCHVGWLASGKVAAANYYSGSTTILPMSGGRLEAAERVICYHGSGPDPFRQEASHAHQVVSSPDGRWFYVCDLGADRVWQHDIAGAGEPCGWVMPAGMGPRHLVFHPVLKVAYVVGELTGSVAVCDWDGGTGALRVAGATAVRGRDVSAAAIRVHPSGRMVWISERKEPMLRGFRVGLDGRLDEGGVVVALGGGQPRDFAISPDGRWLVVANQEADELVVVELDAAEGVPVGGWVRRFPLRTPVAVLFLPDGA